MSYNWDTLGITRSKQSAPGHNVDPAGYVLATEWIRHHILRKFGYDIMASKYDPDVDMWRFYDSSDQLVYQVSHLELQHIQLVLEQVEALAFDTLTHDIRESVSEIPDTPQETKDG